MQQPTTPIAVQPGTRLLRVEEQHDPHCWVIWLSARNCLVLYDTGKIERVECKADGTDLIIQVKGSRDADTPCT